MVIHERVHDLRGAGKWDLNTTRYLPIYGGSRSRLPVADDTDYRRYPAFVGIDESMTQDLYLLGTLYRHLGGKAFIPEGRAGQFVSLILGQTMERLEHEAEEGNDEPAL